MNFRQQIPPRPTYVTLWLHARSSRTDDIERNRVASVGGMDGSVASAEPPTEAC
ncbi:MAG TPA: hypothetical protein VHG89_08485 [Verrucomicrobiae bacterium]|nr:hypothetical protein [Verrucomicrobiae bacterium]